MRFLLTQPFLDAAQCMHPENSVLTLPDDWDGIPSPNWRPMDEKAQALMAPKAVAEKRAKAKAAAEAAQSIVAVDELPEIVGGPQPKPPPERVQMTIKQAALDMPALSEYQQTATPPTVRKRASDKSPV